MVYLMLAGAGFYDLRDVQFFDSLKCGTNAKGEKSGKLYCFRASARV